MQVVFVTMPTGDLVGKVFIQNISLKIVGYKIKTTSPEKYRVRPSTGSLSPGETATVEIYVTAISSRQPWKCVQSVCRGFE